MRSNDERRAPEIDVVEMAVLVAVPAVLIAVAAAVGGRHPIDGAVVGGIIGGFFAAIRRALYAVRTPDGIERRLRSPDDDPRTNRWMRLATAEYPRRYDLLLSAACGLVAVGALVGVLLFADDEWVALRLLAVAVFGFAAALGALGAYSLR